METQRNTEVLLKRYSDIPNPHPLRSPEPFLGLEGVFAGIPSLKLTAIALENGWQRKTIVSFWGPASFCRRYVVSFRECIPLPHHRKGRSSSKPSWKFWKQSGAPEGSFKVFFIGFLGDRNIFTGGMFAITSINFTCLETYVLLVPTFAIHQHWAIVWR